jgi:hypothetical protein
MRARSNGVTREEVVAAITQLAFHAGWLYAIIAISVAREGTRTATGHNPLAGASPREETVVNTPARRFARLRHPPIQPHP